MQESPGSLITALRFRKQFTIDDLRTQFTKEASNMENFPLLGAIVTKDEQYACIRHFYAAIRWYQLVVNKFNRKIERPWSRDQVCIVHCLCMGICVTSLQRI